MIYLANVTIFNSLSDTPIPFLVSAENLSVADLKLKKRLEEKYDSRYYKFDIDWAETIE